MAPEPINLTCYLADADVNRQEAWLKGKMPATPQAELN